MFMPSIQILGVTDFHSFSASWLSLFGRSMPWEWVWHTLHHVCKPWYWLVTYWNTLYVKIVRTFTTERGVVMFKWGENFLHRLDICFCFQCILLLMAAFQHFSNCEKFVKSNIVCGDGAGVGGCVVRVTVRPFFLGMSVSVALRSWSWWGCSGC